MKNQLKIFIVIAVLFIFLGGAAFFFWLSSPGRVFGGGLKISSPAFADNSYIPSKYTCQGEDVNPPLKIDGLPAGTRSLVLIVSDPDAPGKTFLHWLVWNIGREVSFIKENSLPRGAVQGMNDFGKENYGGPCPPSGRHRYFFEVYALDKRLGLGAGSGEERIKSEMAGHVLARARLVGLYQRR